ncbi:hypothetical protein [Chlorogloea sp. CCALA 695]|uniref:hypothetical protein n=1 Tax=Chlorogloea sp. CCALA 695 TaxID=2107693 RepID=UPI000D0835A4|nr:hypothetical protein [Chlorogloea sp. CCALA 695]PSB30838.1 hypothetical protein C7B70_15405 [Chlorogloea sp. CCALA 695]
MKTQSRFDALQSDRVYDCSNGRKRNWKENTTLTGMMVAGTGLMICDISLHNMFLASLVFGTAISIMLPKQTNALFNNFNKLQRKYGVNVFHILFCIVGLLFLLDMAVAPAHAQFMNNAETFFENQTYFPNIDPSVIGFIFGILRGLFLIYLAISLVRVVQGARNDEDWQILARTPIIIAVTVVIGDILAGLVTGVAAP